MNFITQRRSPRFPGVKGWCSKQNVCVHSQNCLRETVAWTRENQDQMSPWQGFTWPCSQACWGLLHLSKDRLCNLRRAVPTPGCTHVDEAVGWLALGCPAAQNHQHQCHNPLLSGEINTLPTSRSWGLWSHTFPSVFSLHTHPSYFYAGVMIKFWNFKRECSEGEALRRQELAVLKPDSCKHHRPRNRWIPGPGTGKLYTACRIHRPRAPLLAPGEEGMCGPGSPRHFKGLEMKMITLPLQR